MAWMQSTVANPGQYLYAVTVAGANLDLFGVISNIEVAERLRQYVTGVSIIQVQFTRGLFTGEIRIFARAERPVSVDGFALEVEQGLNSFWTLAGVRVNAYVSDNLEAAVPAQPADSVSESVKWIAVAVIAAAVAIGLVQLRKTL